MLIPLRLRHYRAAPREIPSHLRMMLSPELEEHRGIMSLALLGMVPVYADMTEEEITRELVDIDIEFDRRSAYELHVAKHGRERRPLTMCDVAPTFD